ncbi:hypothetical protein TSOC_005652 [Tetrabaena socialis]|uniref:SRCR domain-containing protein n=1 Tax=Tetrabaena socialis TaxID=47790 RepID=A0A2J8A5U8_9CHLO|nr:hypothetical protein TSOC_005652 [Tetrabaena socialis]|eukprot:PNH07875.1 hypothetical protein TSOC_005652 [Tetrabaena socialis]
MLGERLPTDLRESTTVDDALGLPVYAAMLVSPESFPSVNFMRLRAKALALTTNYFCPSFMVNSVAECQGIAFASERGGTCMQVARFSALKANYMPAGVACRGVAPPPLPPPPTPPPPRPDSTPGVNYTMRIVNPLTGRTTYSNGSQVSSGILQVLQATPSSPKPVWGTVCAAADLPVGLAQYACRAAGLPYRTAKLMAPLWSPGHVAKYARAMPVHWVYLEDCQLRPQGLDCGIVAGVKEAQELMRRAAVAGDAARRTVIDRVVRFCDGLKHRADIRVTCGDNYQPPPGAPSPPLPPPPAPPPSPPTMVRNDIQLNATEYLTNVYGIQFGVRHPVNGTTVWGTYCPLDEALVFNTDSNAVVNAICSQITAGSRPYGSVYRVEWFRDYIFLPRQEARRDMPAVLSRLDCDIVAGGTSANISLCATELSEPLPMPLSLGCMFGGWTQRLVSCFDTEYLYPRLGAVRLTGGANSSYGRLEVINQDTLDMGWGTVCAPQFGVKHAQAVCRDLGLPWTQAAVLPASTVLLVPPSPLIAMDNIACLNQTGRWRADTPPPLSFARDCERMYVGGSSQPTCGHEADIVMACGGEEGERGAGDEGEGDEEGEGEGESPGMAGPGMVGGHANALGARCTSDTAGAACGGRELSTDKHAQPADNGGIASMQELISIYLPGACAEDEELNGLPRLDSDDIDISELLETLSGPQPSLYGVGLVPHEVLIAQQRLSGGGGGPDEGAAQRSSRAGPPPPVAAPTPPYTTAAQQEPLPTREQRPPQLPPAEPKHEPQWERPASGADLFPRYGIQFGVRHPVNGTTVWGTYCPLDEALVFNTDSNAVVNAICSQITAGSRPYGSVYRVEWFRDYIFLPRQEARRDMPAVLSRLDCDIVAGGTSANISLCATELSEPLPMPLSLGCMFGGWTQRLVSCFDTEYLYPRLGAVRLTGGANSSYGRLEVINQDTLDMGWGTVCAPQFGVKHAQPELQTPSTTHPPPVPLRCPQAVCRDLGLPWTQAAVLPASTVLLVPPSPLIAMDNIACLNQTGRWRADTPPPLSFARDCERMYVGGSSQPTCGHEADIVMACGGEEGERGLP